MTDEVADCARPSISVFGRIRYVRFPTQLSIVFGVAMLLLVLATLSRPAVFPDTSRYMDNGANVYRAAARILHLIPPPKPVSAAVAYDRWFRYSSELTMMGARSPWYGVFARPLEWLGTLWLLAAVQSAIAAWLIWLGWRTLAPGAPPWTAFAVQAVTAAFSTLPFIAGFAMPDVFSGFVIMAAVLLLAAWDLLEAYERAALALLIAFSVTVHSANALVAATVLILAGGLALRTVTARKALAVPMCTVIGALSVGLTALAISNAAINLIHGQAPGRPAFLAIRLIADGPGRTYLKEACARGEPYQLCKYKNKPLDDSQTMLWGNPAGSIFGAASPAERVAMQREEGRFVVATVLHDPIGVAMSSTKNWLLQLGMLAAEAPLVDQRMYLGRRDLFPPDLPQTREIYLQAWDYTSYRDSVLPRMIARVGDCTNEPERCRTRLSIGAARWLQGFEFGAAYVALAAIAVQILKRRSQATKTTDDRWLRTLGFIGFAIVGNALICGAISGPFPRYQSSVVWLAVMLAAIGFCTLATCSPPAVDGTVPPSGEGVLG